MFWMEGEVEYLHYSQLIIERSGFIMNQDQLKGKWKQLTGETKKKWSKLTDNDVKEVDGNKEKLVGKIQERYGKSKEEAEKEVNSWDA